MWYEVVSGWRIWSILWTPEVSKLLLSKLDAVLRVEHIVVGAEVRNEVATGWVFFSWLWVPDVIELLLGQIGTLLGSSDIVVLTEIWHEVVTWVWISHWMSNDIIGQMVADNFLSSSKTNVNILHVSVGAKVWNKVILWMSAVSWRWRPREQWLSIQLDTASLP